MVIRTHEVFVFGGSAANLVSSTVLWPILRPTVTIFGGQVTFLKWSVDYSFPSLEPTRELANRGVMMGGDRNGKCDPSPLQTVKESGWFVYWWRKWPVINALNFIHIIVVVTKANAQSVDQDRTGQALSGLSGEGLQVTEVTHIVVRGHWFGWGCVWKRSGSEQLEMGYQPWSSEWSMWWMFVELFWPFSCFVES